MARPIRVEYEDAVYHVTACGNEHKPIYGDDTDRRVFLDALAQACGQFGLVVHVYCLMPNHYHLVVQTPQANLSQAVGWLQTTYSIRFNRRHQRSGHLFQGRFKAHLVEADAYARRLVVYVHLNPVRPADKQQPLPAERRSLLDRFVWSSHRAYAGHGNAREVPPWLSLEWVWYFGASRGIAQREYRHQIAGHFGRCVPDPFVALRGGFVLGSAQLWEKVKTCVARSNGQRRLSGADTQARRSGGNSCTNCCGRKPTGGCRFGHAFGWGASDSWRSRLSMDSATPVGYTGSSSGWRPWAQKTFRSHAS